MVSIIKNQLLKHLSRFTKNLSADKINLSTFKGEGELSNLELNEIVLTDLLELPSWLRLTKAWCNKVSFRIPWTKLKSVPIFLILDEVNITIETCEELRSTSAQAGLSSYASAPGKYSFIHKVIDGITVIVNTVNVTFNSPAFTASVQISRILVESKTPKFAKSELRMTRLKNPAKGQLLIFKELEWQTVRIEAKSTVDKNLTPLRLLTNQARCRIVIKKRISVSNLKQPNQGQGQPQGVNMYPTPYSSHYPPAPAPGFPISSAPGYCPPQGSQPVPRQYPPPGQHYGGPITNQPMPAPGGWMNMPQVIPNGPSGLEYLTMIDQLLVQQRIEMLEVLTGYEFNNKFDIKNSLGEKVYYAVEENNFFIRNCFGRTSPFNMKIFDNYQNEIIHMYRPYAYCECYCCACCQQTMEVSSPPGTMIGTVEQEWTMFYPKFAIKNASGDTVLRIEGPLCTCTICGQNVEFKVMSSDGSVQVGKISRLWSGELFREVFTDADYFGITFPMDLDPRLKAVMLGACFLINAMFFEKKDYDLMENHFDTFPR